MTDDIMNDGSDDDMVGDERLQKLLARAAELPRNIDPPADAWAGIRSAISNPVAAGRSGASVRRPVAFWQRPVFLAAAATLLVSGSSAITATLIGERTNATPRPVAMSASGDRARPTGPATLAEFTLVENDYIRTASQLSELLQNGESTLSPETIAKLNESLRVIDAAIFEARRALAADPANRAIVEMLSGSYEQKLDLLRRTTEMARS
ncbi:MAG: hypothetical protein ABIR58_07715 [Gemmatimonadaceae bacterium]